MAVATAFDLIKGALKLLQVYSPDVTLSAEESSDGLDSLNLMLEQLSLEQFVIPFF